MTDDGSAGERYIRARPATPDEYQKYFDRLSQHSTRQPAPVTVDLWGLSESTLGGLSSDCPELAILIGQHLRGRDARRQPIINF
jgi:hypothetical protein